MVSFDNEQASQPRVVHIIHAYSFIVLCKEREIH
jgi:hypothetical protein